ncbi:MAG: protein-disulfide reductase DsbD N-terminal domain-containing protein [Burkholderiales bacterium]
MKNMISMSFVLLAGLAALFAPLVSSGAEESGELLDPERAFQFSASLISPEIVEVRYAIADGYYMYRNRFRVEVSPATVVVARSRMPDGIVKEDEFFGRVETYRGELTFRLELQGPAPNQGLELTVISQGCADVGVCYVPLTQRARLKPRKFLETDRTDKPPT